MVYSKATELKRDLFIKSYGFAITYREKLLDPNEIDIWYQDPDGTSQKRVPYLMWRDIEGEGKRG